MAEYQRCGTTVLGLKRSSGAEVTDFGCATGVWSSGVWADETPSQGEAEPPSSPTQQQQQQQGGDALDKAADAAAQGPLVLAVTELAEKPSLALARARLTVPRFGQDDFLTMFGVYACSNRVLDALDTAIRDNLRDKPLEGYAEGGSGGGGVGDFGLTSALEAVRRSEGLHGLVVDGKRFDLGLPSHYVDAIAAFTRSS